MYSLDASLPRQVIARNVEAIETKEQTCGQNQKTLTAEFAKKSREGRRERRTLFAVFAALVSDLCG